MKKTWYSNEYELSLTLKRYGYDAVIHDKILDADVMKIVVPPMCFEDAMDYVNEELRTFRSKGRYEMEKGPWDYDD